MPYSVVPLALSVALAVTSASAGEKTLRVTDQPDIEWSVSYTLGTHRGTAGPPTVDARSDAAGSALTSLVLRFPLESVRSGNATRDCHLREALGLDYKVSHYPAAHVCNKKNEIPATGADQVAFPEIVFEMSPEAAPLRFVPPAPGQTSEIEIPGTWTIHGVSRPDRVTATLSAVGTSPIVIRVEGEHALSLRDFGVLVKPFLMVTVGDRVHVKFSFSIAP
jgi:polyisoprenoid-binding protein YceI